MDAARRAGGAGAAAAEAELTSVGNTFAIHAALYPGWAALRAGVNQEGGAQNPFSGGLSLLYQTAKVTPYISVAVDAFETGASCVSVASSN